MNESFIAGNKGEKIRSDCFLIFEPAVSGGIQTELVSKVKLLYGESIIELAEKMLQHFDIRHGTLKIDDSGALEFVLAARIEAAIKLYRNDAPEFLLNPRQNKYYPAERDRHRISRLYLPGNTPSMMINAGIHGPDGIILDLEDSVSQSKKHEARILVRNALRSLNFYGAEKMVRINQVPAGIDDLKYIAPHGVDVVLIPKTEHVQQVLDVDKEIDNIKISAGIEKDIFLMPIIESALGIENAFSIARSSKNIVAMAIGLEDYTADIGTSRTKEGKESLYARTRLVNACKAAGIQAIDSVFSDLGDEEGLLNSVKESKSIGFEGMGCIHPSQIKMINKGFCPEPSEIDYAEKVVDAFLKAEEQGLGVISLGNKMIDPPVVKRAQKIISLALKSGIINLNWREKYVN